MGSDVGEGMVEHLPVFDYNNFPNSPNSLVLATYLVSVIRDLKQRERWRHGHQNGNRKLIFSLFQFSNSTNSYSDSYSGSQNKGIQIHCVGQKLSIYKRDIELTVAIHDVQDVSTFLASASYFWLRAVPFQSVDSRLGRTGESEIAKRRTGEKERPDPSFPLAGLVFFPPHRSISSLAQPPWGTDRSLTWSKRSKSTSTMIRFPKSFLFSVNSSSFLVKDK